MLIRIRPFAHNAPRMQARIASALDHATREAWPLACHIQVCWQVSPDGAISAALDVNKLIADTHIICFAESCDGAFFPKTR